MTSFATGLVGAFIGPLTTPLAIRLFGDRVPAIGMMLEVAGCTRPTIAIF
ncbi:hypothetical protein AWB81_07608 [Caballeronia arationis]|nr:hypothetical protein [Caballeronia arationis]SAL06474.1 hypothetical protein AWB81_07608 [Caballeronia arationis]